MLQATLDQQAEGSRLWKLANRCLFGVDANERMARTSKMNMIMHGDGHGGVHHHNGLLNVNGIFEDRFDIIMTNPPFGASVEPQDKVTTEQIHLEEETYQLYVERYGAPYVQARARLEAALNEPIGGLLQVLGRNAQDMRTERRHRNPVSGALPDPAGPRRPAGRGAARKAFLTTPRLDRRAPALRRPRPPAGRGEPARRHLHLDRGHREVLKLLFLQRHTAAEAAAYQAALTSNT
ncbi:MAG: N-6 DNA methylase [Hymenobacter sp.]